MRHCILVLMLIVMVIPFTQRTQAEEYIWDTDVLVHQANQIYGFGMDQADKDTLLLVVTDSSTTNLRDTLYIYRSTNDGQTWNYVDGLLSGGDNVRMGKSDILAAKGDSNFVFVFFIYNHKLWYARYNYSGFSGYWSKTVSDDNVVDFSVCQDLWSNYWLYIAYQTDEDSVVFQRSRDYGLTWEDRKNLSQITPIISQPSLAYSRGVYLVVAGKTSDDKIYVIRNDNSGNSANWKDGQYPSGISSCEVPVVAASHTEPENEAIFWLFYERYVGSPPLNWMINFHWSTDAGSTWTSMTTPNDTSSYNRVNPSLHVLKENEASNITFAFRYEGTSPRQIRYIYKENAQSSPSVWNVSYSGINDHSPHYRPPQRGYTLRGTDNSVRSGILYVGWTDHDLYFDASAFTEVETQWEDQIITEFSLKQNYPNPFNPSTQIEFDVPENGWVNLDIYNVLGQKVRQLLSDHLEKGLHRITWDGKDDNGEALANGVYFYRLQTSGISETKKMILVK